LPASDWNFSSRDWLRGDLSADPDGLKQSLREKSRFFCDGRRLPLPRGAHELRKQADRILAGELPYFSHNCFKVGFPPDWHLNLLDGARIPSSVHRSEIDLDTIHDVKFVWEPSRFSFAYCWCALTPELRTTATRKFSGLLWKTGHATTLRIPE
jgi:hypothetical protein